MTVCTENFEVFHIGLPVFKPAAPRPNATFRSNFLGWVNVIQLQNTDISNSAGPTFTAKLINNFGSGAPITFLFSGGVLLFLAICRAISAFCRFSAIHALTAIPPSFGGVARVRTIFRIVTSGAALLNIKLVSAHAALPGLPGGLAVWGKADKPLVPSGGAIGSRARLAAKFPAGATDKIRAATRAFVMYWFHRFNVVCSRLFCNYFEIACERVQKAYDQPDLFIAPPKKPEQEAMDL